MENGTDTTQVTDSFGYTASQVADYFIQLSSQKMVDENTPEGVSPLKLQKLLYFAQAASLALTGKKLFEEEIQAWKFGPVIASVYHAYKDAGNTPLIKSTGEFESITDEEAQKMIRGVWELFDKYSASELVEITHNHTPWKESYKEGLNQTIDVNILRDYYKNIFTYQETQEATA